MAELSVPSLADIQVLEQSGWQDYPNGNANSCWSTLESDHARSKERVRSPSSVNLSLASSSQFSQFTITSPAPSSVQGRIRYEHTGEISLPPVRRRHRRYRGKAKAGPLRAALRRARELNPTARAHLLEAEEYLHGKKNTEAIPHLESGLLESNE